jgi:hypothetical protein
MKRKVLPSANASRGSGRSDPRSPKLRRTRRRGPSDTGVPEKTTTSRRKKTVFQLVIVSSPSVSEGPRVSCSVCYISPSLGSVIAPAIRARPMDRPIHRGFYGGAVENVLSRNRPMWEPALCCRRGAPSPRCRDARKVRRPPAPGSRASDSDEATAPGGPSCSTLHSSRMHSDVNCTDDDDWQTSPRALTPDTLEYLWL